MLDSNDHWVKQYDLIKDQGFSPINKYLKNKEKNNLDSKKHSIIED